MPNKDDTIQEIQYESQRNEDEWQTAVTEHTRLGYSMFRVHKADGSVCLLYTSPSPRDKRQSRMPSSA